MSALIAGCSAPEPVARRSLPENMEPVRSLSMERLCKGEAAQRYNTRTQDIVVTGVERFRSRYELQGETSKKERFVCSFDTGRRFLYLSMR